MPTDLLNRRLACAGLLIVIAAGGTAGCAADSDSGPESGSRGAASADTSSSSTAPDSTGGAKPKSPNPTSSEDDEPSTTASPTKDPALTPPTGALEMPPTTSPAEGSSGTGSESTMAEQLAEAAKKQDHSPLLSRPLPAGARANGSVVAGFPEFLRPVGNGAVVSSSLSPSGDKLQVALVATTGQRPDEVALRLREQLSQRSMRETQRAPASAPGTETFTFTRGSSSVTVTVSREGNETTYTVFGTLTADEE